MNAKFSTPFLFCTLRFRVRSIAFSLLAGVLLVCASANAQLAGKGAISGTVFDATGAAIPGASITATDTATAIAVTTTSTSAGDYSFSASGSRQVQRHGDGERFSDARAEGPQGNALETLTYNPKLPVGATDVSVTVTTAPPALETSNAELGATMENDMYSALPIEMGAYGRPDQRRARTLQRCCPACR